MISRCQLFGAALASIVVWTLASALGKDMPPPAPLDFSPARPDADKPQDTPPKPADAPSVFGVLGRAIQGPENEDMGKVIDVLVDRDGRPVAALIDFGGFLGVGSRKVAVSWDVLRFGLTALDSPARIALSRSEVQAAPEYKPSAPVTGIVGWHGPPYLPAAPRD